MDAAGDAVTGRLSIAKIIVVKATAGTVTFKDSTGTVILLTGALADTSMTQIDFPPWISDGFEYDAVSAGTAIVYVYLN